MLAFLSLAELIRECETAGFPGLRPHTTQTLCAVRDVVLEALDNADAGLLVLAVDGLGWRSAARGWTHGRLVCLTSTFPSTSVTAWTSAVTGLDVGAHLGAGMCVRVPGPDVVAHVVTNRPMGFVGLEDPGARSWADGELIRPSRNVFELACLRGHAAVAIPADMDTVPGPWTAGLFRGAACLPTEDPAGGRDSFGCIDDPEGFALALIRRVDVELAKPRARRLLLWAYVNLDDHLHRRGHDENIDAVLRLLEEAALRWAGRGWTVHAYGDHGQTACRRNPVLEALWNRLNDPRFCRLPSGGAGRVRWLFPRSDRRSDVFATLRDGLGEHALVSSPEELAGHGLWRLTPELRERVGDVVAVAASDEFPLPEPALPFEHGALTPEEMLVPFASWSAGQSRESGG